MAGSTSRFAEASQSELDGISQHRRIVGIDDESRPLLFGAKRLFRLAKPAASRNMTTTVLFTSAASKCKIIGML